MYRYLSGFPLPPLRAGCISSTLAVEGKSVVEATLFCYDKAYFMKKILFTDRVYEVVRKIPKGKVLTYKEVARRAGSPNAYRAVGNILSKNFDPKIPCHRVIGTDGKMHGYNRGGIQTKLKILKREKVAKRN